MSASLKDRIQTEVRRLFSEKTVDVVLALRNCENGMVPNLYTAADSLDDLTPGPKWPLAKTALLVMRELSAGTRLGLVCRTCDSRAVTEQVRLSQYPGQTVRCIVMPCDEEQAESCSCTQPRPDAEPLEPIEALTPRLRGLLNHADRASQWLEHFQRCIKCYGCRNVCPVCVCPVCRLEDDEFVPSGVLPPSPLPWHLCRATHVADSCVSCGACQDACPAGIPLLVIHAALAGHLQRTAAYRAGAGAASPLHTPALQEGPCGMSLPEWKNSFGSGEDKQTLTYVGKPSTTKSKQ